MSTEKQQDKPSGARRLTTQETILQFVRAIVDDPAGVSVSEIRAGGYVILEIFVSQGDRGVTLGREGRMLRSLRTIANRLGSMRGERVRLEMKE